MPPLLINTVGGPKRPRASTPRKAWRTGRRLGRSERAAEGDLDLVRLGQHGRVLAQHVDGAVGKATDVRISQVMLPECCGDHRFGLLSELRPAARSPIKQRKTEVPPQCIDCIADGGHDTPQGFRLWQ